MLMRWCSTCFGKGWIDDSPAYEDEGFECPACEGSGLERDPDDNPGRLLDKRPFTC